MNGPDIGCDMRSTACPMERTKWEIHLMPMNIGYNGLKYTDQYAFPEYKKDMPYFNLAGSCS